MAHFCHYIITGDLKAVSDCNTRNNALKLNRNVPDVCLSCSAYRGKRTGKIDLNTISPESKRALLNFVGGFIDLEAYLISYGASSEDIRTGAIEAIDNIIKTDPKKKARILKTFKASRGDL